MSRLRQVGILGCSDIMKLLSERHGGRSLQSLKHVYTNGRSFSIGLGWVKEVVHRLLGRGVERHRARCGGGRGWARGEIIFRARWNGLVWSICCGEEAARKSKSTSKSTLTRKPGWKIDLRDNIAR